VLSLLENNFITNLFIMKKSTLVLFIILCLYKISFSQNWQSFGDFENNMVSAYSCLYSDSITNLLYIGGSNVNANGINYSGIVAYNGTNFSSLGNGSNCLHHNYYGGFSAVVHSVINYKNEIYAGGFFKYADTNIVNSIARWDGTNWLPVDKGVISKTSTQNGSVRALFIFQDTLYVGGAFDSIAGSNIECDGIVKWDGTNWHPIADIDTTDYIRVDAIAEYNNKIYIGGNFEIAQNDRNIARWDGNQWHSVGGGMHGFMDNVSSLVVYKGYLYAGGSFSQEHGNIGNYIARWDGNEWSEVGGSVQGITPTGNAQIHGMGIYNDELWVGGALSYAGGIPAKWIAKWDGEKWCSMEQGFDNRVRLFAVYNDMLYVGGGFKYIGNQNIPYIAKWTGGSYVDTCSTPSGIIDIAKEEKEIIVYPNPANNILSIVSDKDIVSYEIFSITGQKIKRGKYSEQININELTYGLYFIRVNMKNISKTLKFIKE